MFITDKTHTMWYQQLYAFGWQTLFEAGTNYQNSYSEINKTIILDLTNIQKTQKTNQKKKKKKKNLNHN